jgi:hypothetical protein
VKTVPFPTTLRIGYRDFVIEQWDAKAASGAGKYGECDRNHAIIRVDTSYGPVQSAETLLHEVMHGCFGVAGIADEDNEERTITHLSAQLTQVLRDNPHLLAYLGHALA